MKPTLTLEIESDDARRHREHREAMQAEKRRQSQDLDERRRRPLSGSVGDIFQRNFWGNELFQ